MLRPGGGEAWLAGWFTDHSSNLGYATVTATLLNLRSGPGTGSSIIDRLSRGSELASIGQNGSWYRVVLNSGTTGWVHGDFISWGNASTPPAPAPPAQPVPNGIGYNTEYFDTSGLGNVYFNQVYIARVLPVAQYSSFK